MKQLQYYFKGVFLFLMFLGFVQAAHSQYMVAKTNPFPIVPSGESVEFKVTVSPGTTFTNSYLYVVAPVDWTITSANAGALPVTTTIAVDGKTARITFPTISDDTDVSVFMKPGCSIVDEDQVFYDYFNSSNVSMAQTTSPDISNIKYPVVVFTPPADTTVKATMTAYREWKIQQNELNSYLMGGDLTVSVVSTPGTGTYTSYVRILDVEILTNTGWQTIPATIQSNQLGYTYTFTAADFAKIGNGDSHISSGEVIRVRERIKYDYCYVNSITNQAKLTYTISHKCPQTKTNNGESVVIYGSPYPSGYSISNVIDIKPTTASGQGKLVIKIDNLNDLPFENYYLDFVTSGTYKWNMNVISAYFSDNLGNIDGSAPPVAVVKSGTSTYFRFENSVPYKGFADTDGDGVYNDLTKSASNPIYLTINWNLDVSDFGSCGSTQYLFTESINEYCRFNPPGCTNTISSSVLYWIDSQNLGFSGGIGSVANPMLTVPVEIGGLGDITTLTITDYPASTYYPNSTWLNSTTAQTHRVQLVLPVDLVYVPSGGVKINGVAVAAGDISYDAGTRTLTFYNRTSNLTTSQTYTLTVQAVHNLGSPRNQVEIKHMFDWGGTTYTYGCQTVPVTYQLYVPLGCITYIGENFRTERASFGYKSKTDLTRYASIDEARAAGVDLKLIGPNDDVELAITARVARDSMVVDNGKPLYADVSYHSTQGAAQPYFTKGSRGAILEYQRPGSSIWSAPISIPASEVLELYNSGQYTLRTDISPYLVADNVPLLANTRFRVTFLARATTYLPTEKKTVHLLESSIHGENNYNYGCSMPVDNLYIVDYGVVPAPDGTTELPTDQTFWQNGNTSHNTYTLLKLTMNNGIMGITTEFFPNEYRPNAILDKITSAYVYSSETVIFDKLYDSEGRIFYEGIDYTVNHNSSYSTVVFGAGMNALLGEYYNSKDNFSINTVGAQSYYIFAEVRSVCGANYSCGYANVGYNNYPTSALPVYVTTTWSCRYNARSSSAWSIATSSTAPTQKSGSKDFSWPLRLTNSSTWTSTSNGADYFMPNTYLFIEITEGGLNDLELYSVVGGTETKITAPWVEYSGTPGSKSYWIKLGNLTGEYLSSSSCKLDYILKSKYPDCTVAGTIKFKAKFAVNTVTYPTDPYTGFSEYNRTSCYRDVPTTELTGTFLPMDFSGTVLEHPTGTDGKFILCTPALFDISFVNNLYASVKGLQARIRRDSKEALLLMDPATTMKYVQNGVTVPYNASTWVVDDSHDDYILITLPQTVLLAPKDEAGDVVVLTVSLEPTCDFLFGKPIYITTIGSSLCDLVESKNIATNNIGLDGYDDSSNPLVQLPQFSVDDVNGLTFVVPYLSASDGKITLKGRYTFRANDANLATTAYIQLPPNMRLVSGGTNTFVREGGGVSTSFVFNSRNRRLTAQFANNELTTVNYTFEVEVEAYNPQLWDCSESIISVGAMVDIKMYCHPTDPEPCTVNNATLNRDFRIVFQKHDINIVAGSVTLTETYDYVNNRENLKVKARVRNNGAYDISNLNLYLYKDNNSPEGYDWADRKIVNANLPFLVSIPANTEYAFEGNLTLAAADVCDLILGMPKNGAGTVNEYLCDSAYVKPTLTYQLALANDSICQGDIAILGDPAIPGYTYLWTTEGTGNINNPNSAQIQYTYPKSTSIYSANQLQDLTLTITRNGECSEVLPVTVYVTPKVSHWIGDYNTTWEYAPNWQEGIPGKCTYVYIPETAIYYPILTKAMTDPNSAKCDTIEFLNGGEVAKTYLLDYNAAKVRLALDPDRWYMLSSPLRYMVTGDYYVDGTNYIDYPGTQKYNPNALKWGRTPDVWWMYYRMANPQTAVDGVTRYNSSMYWSMPFNILDEKMDPGKGLMVWPDLETNMSTDTDPTHLKSGRVSPSDNKARFTFPRSENEYYYYNGIDFNDPTKYIGPEKQGDRADNPLIAGVQEWKTTLPRQSVVNGDSLRSRFGYEGLTSFNKNTGSFTMNAYVDDPSAATAMVGNPFMSHLDLRAFQAANTGTITTDFYVWANGASGPVYEALKLSSMNYISTGSTTGYVAPMQSFIVVKKPSPAAFSTFSVTSIMSVTQPTDKLRSGGEPEVLNLAIYKGGNRESAVALVYDDKVSNDYDASKDQYTLFPSDKKPVILYALANSASDMKALSIHTVGDLSTAVVPLAIRTSQKGDLLTLRLSGSDLFDSSYNIYLEDTSTKLLHNMRKDSTFTFTNFTGNIEPGRFYLRFINSPTDIKDAQVNDFYIYASNGHVYIYSEKDLITNVEAFNLQGQSIYRKSGLNTEYHSFDLYNHENQVVIVRVQTRDGVKSKKVLMK